jgi:hypothetical protein
MVRVQERISSVHRRIETTEGKIAVAEGEATFYRRVIDFVHDNPPDDPSHLAHIDKVGQVFVHLHHGTSFCCSGVYLLDYW